MEKREAKILSLESLLIGYKSGERASALIPSLTASVRKGELIALIGQNGTGKSTLLRTITGLHPALGGDIIINGKKLGDYQRYDLAKNIGYISTEPVRVTNMTVTDLVRLGRYPHTSWTGKLEEEDHELVADAIRKTGLESFTGRYINELSDGERQRAMIARILAQDAEILLMDEPTAFLDVKSRYEMIHLLHDLTFSRGKTIIFSTHDMLTAIGESDRIWLISGDSFTDGAPEDLILNGSFEKLFADSVVKFNSSDASFSYKRKMHGTVGVEADGIVRYWTEKAANRAGFEVSETGEGLRIKVIAGVNGVSWQATRESEVLVFSSLYELVKWLGEQGQEIRWLP
jgi:iron complex transport system ATP-binding protein